MPTDGQAVQATLRYQRQLAAATTRAEAVVAAIWDNLGSWDDTDIKPFTKKASPVVAGVVQTASALTAGYHALLLAAPVATVDLAPLIEAVDYRDPFVGYWAALSRGEPWDEAITTGRTRAGTLGRDGATNAARNTADEIDRNEDRIVGYERVPSGVTCEFCAIAATQRYHSAESASFGHTRCACSVVPIIGKQNPGRTINRPLLDSLKNLGDDATGYVTNDGTPAPRPAPAPVEVP